MKIGILTFHYAINHGAVLQAYATQELLRSMGHEVEVIDYHNRAVDAYYEAMRFHLGVLLKKRKKRYLLSPILFWLQCRAFKKFIDSHLSVSARKYVQGQRPKQIPDYDLILVGSDQLWNLKITGGFDDWYWGVIPENSKGGARKIATWAVCMNDTEQVRNETTRIAKLLENFSALSVRESNLKEAIAPLTEKNVVQTLDPTLLLPAEKWKSLCKKPPTGNYVVAYAIEFWDKRKVAKVAARLATLKNMRLVLLRVYAETGSLWDALHGCGPDDFLTYLCGASYVVTSSFHGTAFSIIFKKQFFCVIDPEKGNTRVENLLQQTGLESQKIGYEEKFENVVTIDYEARQTDSRLAAYREKSIGFIEQLTQKA